MEKPNYIKECELKDEVYSINSITMPEGFDDYLKDKKMELVYSESSTDFETSKTMFSLKIYKTKQGFYLYLLIRDTKTDITIYYKQKQQDELTIFMGQLIKQFKNATINNKRTERKD
jgi:hypothetical protein